MHLIFYIPNSKFHRIAVQYIRKVQRIFTPYLNLKFELKWFCSPSCPTFPGIFKYFERNVLYVLYVPGCRAQWRQAHPQCSQFAGTVTIHRNRSTIGIRQYLHVVASVTAANVAARGIQQTWRLAVQRTWWHAVQQTWRHAVL